MSDCGVCIVVCDFDGIPEFHDVSWPKAREPHKCLECKRVIPVGAKYERSVGKFDGEFFADSTCAECSEIAEAFSCDGKRIIGTLWEDMESVMRELTTTCFDRLTTPEAKAYLRERWMQWKGLSAVS